MVTLFCTQEHGLLLQDCSPRPPGVQALLALDVPYYYYSCKVRTESTLPVCVLHLAGVIHIKICCLIFLCHVSCVFLFMLVIILMCNSVFGPIHPQLLFRRGDVFLPEVSVCSVRFVQKASVFFVVL